MHYDELKTTTLNLRVAPSFKADLRAVADLENRSMVNMLEVVFADYCRRKEIKIVGRDALKTKGSK